MVRLLNFSLTGTDGGPPGQDADWIPVEVPGGVHEALVSAGLLRHPYTVDEAEVGWVERRTWWYRAEVELPTCPALLRFEGLDGVATVWLDEVELGTHANQFRPAEFGVTGPAGTRTLLVRFVPPLDGLVAPDQLKASVEALTQARRRIRPRAEPPAADDLLLRLQRVRRRKAACSWGWDLGPRLPSIGLHGVVSLLAQAHHRILGVHARTTSLDSSAVLAVTVAARVSEKAQVEVELRDPDGDVVAAWSGAAAAELDVALDVSEARAWWPHDLGEQPLYSLQVRLVRGDDVLDERTERVGLRTIELDRTPVAEGRLFRLVVNGVPIFVRGANWVPASLLVGSVPPSRYRELVEAARHAQMNALRVWGGGVYEHDAFYEACDELGVLVWQDFMFACDDYPSGDPGLTAEVHAEAVHQVRRLRNHPCLALWAGNNEVQGIHEIATGEVTPGPWGWSWFAELLPGVVAEHSPGAVYWPGSPWGEDPSETVNGVRDGDRHAWEVWHGIDVGAGTHEDYATPGEAAHPRRYLHDTGRFISEFGIHAAPELATLQRWSGGAPLALDSPAFLHRNKDTPGDKAWALMELETGLPTTLEQYVDFSMACQAEGLKLGVEHYRRRQPACSGTLVWQFNDVWPGLSWSVLDHDLVGKAGYWFLQRAYAPVLASFRQAGDRVELWVTNSVQRAVDLDLDVRLGRFDQVRTTTRVASTAAPYSSGVVWSAPLDATDLITTVSDRGGLVPANRLFLAPLKDLPLTGHVTGVARRTGSTAEVTLTATGYAYLAHVRASATGVRFSINHLDLHDGEQAVVTASGLPRDATLSVASYGRAAVALTAP
ncbi:MAG: glycoside hydrolase, family 2 [Frankiales bacterium]|nr:glycoside hydrolase, family 2 [Frankiales bacterium]